MIDWELVRPNDPIHDVAFAELSQYDDYGVEKQEDLKLVIDIGANCGYFALKVLENFPDCEVRGFEADPANYEICLRNLKKLGIKSPQVNVANFAVWSHADGVTVEPNLGGVSHVVDRVGDDNPGFLEERIASGETLTIPSVTLDSILDGHTEVDMLKLDVEGAEYEILRAVSPEQLAKCRFIGMELHDWFGPERRQALEDKIATSHKITARPKKGDSGIIHAERL